MSVTASVTLSLADIDKLRDDIKELTSVVRERDNEIAKLKADSKQVLVTEEEIGYDIDEYMLSSILKHPHMYTDSSSSARYSSGYNTIAGAIKACIKSGVSLNKKVFYKNLDDVQKEIRDKLELEYQDELREAKASVRKLNDTIKEVREEEKKKRKELQGHHEVEVASNQEAYKELLASYNALESGKRELTEIERLNEVINKLHEELSKERNKGWLKRLFS